MKIITHSYPNLKCEKSNCYFEKACKDIKFDNSVFSLFVREDGISKHKEIQIPLKNLFVDSSLYDPKSSNEYCYLTILASEANK